MRLRTPLLMAACTAVLLSAHAAGAAGVHVGLEPPSTTVAAGTTFTVKAVVSPADAPFNAFDLLVRFDNTRLQYVTSTNAADSLVTAACGNRFQIFKLLNAQPADPDTLQVNLSLLCAGASMTGPGAIYRWQFKALAPGTTTLSFVGGTAFYNAGQNVPPVETRDMTVTVPCPTVTLTPGSLPGGAEGAAYSQQLGASGGAAPYTFALASGDLPAGLALSSAGAITGTPSATGAASFTVAATDVHGCSGSGAYSISIGCPVLAITPASLPAATVGAAYAQALAASGGTAPYTFALASGALPAGLALAADGTITGTPTAPAASSFEVTATDAAGCSRTVTHSITAACPAIALAPGALPGGTVGAAYSAAITPSGGTAPYTFALGSGTPPAGLTLAVDGTLAGTPAAAGDASFTAIATDAYGCTGSRTVSVSIVCPAITLTPDTLPAGTAGVPYTAVFGATGGAAPYAFTVTAGALPPGLVLAADGTLSGTPATGGGAAFTVTAAGADGCGGSRAYALDIGCATLAITPETLADPVAGEPYSATLRADGGAEPIAFTIADGTMPAGLELATDGTISGTPATLSLGTFTVLATDAHGCTGTREYTLNVGCPDIAIARDSATAHVNLGYTSPLVATAGTPPYVFQIADGALPDGLALEDSVITGVPTTAGTYAFTLHVTDANGCQADRADTIEVIETLAAGDDVPLAFALESVLPNPRAPGARGLVTFALPRAATVRLELFDVAGRLVAAREPEEFAAGRHRLAWSPARLASGVYLMRLRSDAGTRIARWIVLP